MAILPQPREENTMKAIKINPFDQSITEIDLPGGGDLSAIYGALSHPEAGIEVNMFDVFRIGGDVTDVIYIDDEGLFKSDQMFYRIGMQPLAGIGILVGTDKEGDTIEPSISLDHVRYLFDRNIFSWVASPFDAMQQIRGQSEAAAKAAEAKGLQVERTEFGFMAFGPNCFD
jgi:hypothetical protein